MLLLRGQISGRVVCGVGGCVDKLDDGHGQARELLCMDRLLPELIFELASLSLALEGGVQDVLFKMGDLSLCIGNSVPNQS